MLESKLNHKDIEVYAAQFSSKICDSFFEFNDTITGREIVEVSPVKQVNYFVLKILFRKWQKEALTIQSPYFDYRNEDVRKALLSFMNVLSQQISIGRGHFEPLMQLAVKETLLAILSPYEFFNMELTGHESGRLSSKYLKNSAKYIKVNHHLFDEYQSRFEQTGKGELSHTEALKLLNEIFGNPDVEIEDFRVYEEQFEEITGAGFAALSKSDRAYEEVDEKEDNNYELWDDSLLTETAEEEETEEDAVPENAWQDSTEEEEEDNEEDEDEELVKFIEEEVEKAFLTEPGPAKQVTKRSLEFLEETDDKEITPLSQRFSPEKPTVHERLEVEKRQSLAEMHQIQKIDNILASITVNQRYMFVNELFDGRNSLFEEAIGSLEGCTSFDDAVEFLIHTYSKKLDWDMNAPEVKELLKIIFKKFR